ncbi:3-galactosyl-N-acetylglucosaminide 4-alpha-L-fucosyltransferase FUT3-like, partial [Diadema antillarum]|uniref:3-galactosyl-N-acetylglucosaminide 4-alpha-L-fucosyltransferase FUT3-like n=1 Tax=Diadema antillarum TaxID=105358 RepID=UPI003A84EF67
MTSATKSARWESFLEALRRAMQLLAWVSRSCLYPYAFFLGIVTVVAVFQVINLIDPPYVIKFQGALEDRVALSAPDGSLPECVYDVLIFAKPILLSRQSEFVSLTSQLKKVAGHRRDIKVECDAEPKQVQCSLQVSVSANETDLKHRDVVIFGLSPSSLRGRIDGLKSDSLHKPNQLWVFMSMLAPLKAIKLNPKLGSFPVHLSWTYMSASELTTPFGYYIPDEPMDTNVVIPNHSGKRKIMAWMGNNCGTDTYWPRDAYLNELSKHIHIDRYGPCTNLTCLPMDSEQCGMLMGQYKFFIAFEDAECQEYITNQFWQTALLHYTIPVVYGARKVSFLKFAPPGSYIHAADFASPKALADYLKVVAKNDGLYLKYFKWRSLGSIKKAYPPFRRESLCRLLPHIRDVK